MNSGFETEELGEAAESTVCRRGFLGSAASLAVAGSALGTFAQCAAPAQGQKATAPVITPITDRTTPISKAKKPLLASRSFTMLVKARCQRREQIRQHRCLTLSQQRLEPKGCCG